MDFGRSVSVALDPVLVPAGFQAGQYSDHHVTFCAEHDELSDRYPSLPQSNTYERGTGRCIDLLVDHNTDGSTPLDFEGRSLAETLRALHLDDDAKTIERTVNAPLSAALPVLTDVLYRLFRTP